MKVINELIKEHKSYGSQLADIVHSKVEKTHIYVDDYKSVSEAVSNLKEYSVLCFSNNKKYDFEEVEISTNKVKIMGGGIINGTFIINANEIDICELKFYDTVRIPIKIKKCRYLRIYDNDFYASDKAIYTIPSIGKYTDENNEHDTLRHSIGLVSIFNNHFFNVNYAVYGEINKENINDTTPETSRWMRLNDWHVYDNFINVAEITAFYLDGCDGISINGNTVFSKNNSLIRENNVFIGQSDMTKIENNNFFASGKESIKCYYNRNIIISGNHFSSCGEIEPCNVIYLKDGSNITGLGNAVITGNIFNCLSNTGVKVLGDKLKVLLNNNSFKNVLPYNYMKESSTVNVTLYADVECVESVIDDNIRNGLLFKVGNYTYINKERYVVNLSFAQVGEVKDVIKLNGKSGLLSVTVYNTKIDDNVNKATYLFNFSHNTSSTLKQLELISKVGVIGDGSNGNTNWCSFNFSFDTTTGYIKATSVSPTKGTFIFVLSLI